ncbi:MAG: cupin domain-containing protein [Flavobacteriaceae bacterium]|nr:cupin domain-containing protein [Flavobacteriaceae bacterium]
MATKLDSVSSKEIAKGFHARFIHTESFTLSFVDVVAGSILPEHSHFHEQTSHIIQGEFEMTVNGKTEILKPGMVVVIPSNVVHSGRALTNCKIHDVFCPVREDYK